MNRTSLEFRLLLAAVLLVGLVPLAWVPSALFPSVVPKGALIRMAGLLAAAAVLLLWIRNRIRVSLDPTAFFLAALTAVWLISALTGVSPSHSMAGDLERMFGLATWAALLALYVALRTLLQGAARARWLERSAAAVGLLSILVGAAIFGTTGSRTGTFGNPSFFAIYSAVVGGFAMLLAVDRAQGPWRWLGWATAAPGLLAALLIGERAAAVSVVGGALVAALAALLLPGIGRWTHGGRGRDWILAAGLLLVLSIAAILSWSALTSALADDLAIQFRRTLWGSALEAFRARPLLGFGPENFAVASTRHIDPSIYLFGENPYVDRAHNVYLDRLVDGGPLSLIAYLCLWASVIVAALRGWSAGRLNRGQASITIGVVIAYMAYLFLWFEDLASLTLMIMLAASLWARVRESPTLEVGEPRPASSLGPLITGVTVLLVVVLGYQAAGRVMLAATAGRAAQQEQRTVEQRLASYQRALGYRAPEARELVLPYVDYLQDFTPELTLIQTDPYRLQVVSDNVDRALVALDDAIEADPQMDVWWLQRGSLLAFAANLHGDRRYLEYALRDVEQAIRLSPARFRNYHFLARLRLANGDTAAALATVDSALAVFDRYPETWSTRSEMLAAAGRWAEAGVAMSRVYTLNSVPLPGVVRSVVEQALTADELRVATGMMDEMLRAGEASGWNRLAAVDPDLAWILERRVELYAEAGDQEGARGLESRWDGPAGGTD